jgi:hypothetical protein
MTIFCSTQMQMKTGETTVNGLHEGITYRISLSRLMSAETGWEIRFWNEERVLFSFCYCTLIQF